MKKMLVIAALVAATISASAQELSLVITTTCNDPKNGEKVTIVTTEVSEYTIVNNLTAIVDGKEVDVTNWVLDTDDKEDIRLWVTRVSDNKNPMYTRGTAITLITLELMSKDETRKTVLEWTK